jgi:hypothetical protein
MSYTKRHIEKLIEQEGEDYVNDLIFGAADEYERNWEEEREVFLAILNEYPNLTDLGNRVLEEDNYVNTLPF